MSIQIMMWVVFAALLLFVFIIDLGIFNRKSHEIRFREALIWTLFYISLALLFNAWVYYEEGRVKAMEFFTAYLLEESLSVDNLFVFIMIFTYFKVRKAHQPKILKWGIIGAMIMRGIFIMTGIQLIERFHWMIFVFGGILVITGIRMAFDHGEGIDLEKNRVVRLARRFVPITSGTYGDRFFIRRMGIIAATPLFLALLVIESSDVIFAVDSIPAVLAVSRDPFIVYSSNIFAIMGLRSLYYLLANVMEMFVYLKFGVSVILTFVGAKMIMADIYHISIGYSLGTIVSVLAVSILLSLAVGSRKAEQ